MKIISLFSLMVVVLLSPVANGCGQKSKTSEGSPEATFENLVEAIKNKDIERYAACWYSESAEREGMISQIRSNPGLWDELQAMFVGPLTLKPDGEEENRGHKTRKFTVEAPDVPEGKGIGGLSMVEEGGVWKMYHW